MTHTNDARTDCNRIASALSPAALLALSTLEDVGYEAWVVGGFVRDALRGVPCSDVDIASSAHWQEAQACFRDAGFKTRETGTKHGTLTVIIQGEAFEVTTFRTDGSYSDNRRPDSVSFVSNIQEDLKRRDFTINAMAFHPQRGLIDPFHGQEDLEAGIIRAVGNPDQRFREDGLRILRACRFASQLGFQLDPETRQAMWVNKVLMNRVSIERITHELDLLLCGQHVHHALMCTSDVLESILPEITACKGFDQRTPYHIYDVWEHIAYVVQNTPPNRLVRWAALFHDIGKPSAFFTHEDGVGHFYGHARISEHLARGVMCRLKMSPGFIEKVILLVRIHDDVIPATPRSVKRALAKLGGNTELFRALCDLKRADALSQAPHCHERVELADELERVLDQVIASDDTFSLKGLAITGRDVIAAGVPEGPEVGVILQAALNAVIDEQIGNDPTELQAFVEDWVRSQ